MHTLTRRLLTALTAASVGLFGTVSTAASAETAPASATIVQADPERSCVGEAATLSWTPPAEVAGLAGYEIVRQHYAGSTPSFVPTRVGPDQTSLTFTIPFGLSIFLIYPLTSDGRGPKPFATASVRGNRAPFAMNWDNGLNDAVGDGTATVTYRWYGPVTESTTGGRLATTVRITASPGGASVDIPTGDSWSVTHTFSGLTNGVDYTLNAVTFNACGASPLTTSAVFTPGVAPVWKRDAPPLTAGRGGYVYLFSATGDPTPAYELLDAPAWLQISPKGLVSGRPPAGTDSFSYSVVAHNSVGIHPFDRTEAVAGPFTVSVRSL